MIIKNSYPGYYEENNYLKNGHYSVMWNNKNVYQPECINDYNEKINGIDEILWINLHRSVDRKNKMNEILRNITIPNRRIEAIDGKDDMKKIIDTQVNSFEIACTLSHLKAIHSLKDKSGDYFLIIEDDIHLKNINYFNINLSDIIKNCPDFDILMLHKTYDKLENMYTNWNMMYNKGPEFHIASTVAYVISRKGIDKMLSLFTYDTFTFYTKIDVADKFLYKNCNTWVYKYNFISSDSEDSYIHSDHLEWHKKCNMINDKVIINDLFEL
jgi:GR25 family glycosyltransferase involved in LPS biosynthesis